MRRALRLGLASLLVGCVALITCARAGALVLGVNVHPEEPATALSGAYDPAVYGRVLDQMQAAGVQMVRVFVPWVWLEPNRAGTYDSTYLATMDRYVQAVRAHGMQVLMDLVATPCWATSDPDPGCVNGNYAADDTGSGYPPADDSQAGDVAAFIAQRWTPAALEVWNEPNSPQYFTPPPGEDAASAYTAMDKAIYTAVKAVEPTTTIVAGSIAEGDTAFLGELYADGIGAYADAISIHPYDVDFGEPFEYWGDPSTPFADDPEASFSQAVPAMHQVMVTNGDADKPLWLTEFGSAACDPSDAPCLDEQTQAQYLKNSLSEIRTWPYVQVALIHEAWDYLPDENLWNGFGLLRNDFTRRPAYCVLAQATGGAPDCESDPLPAERSAQDDLTRAWTLARDWYLAHQDSFSGFNPAALSAADPSFSGYGLDSENPAPSTAAGARAIGISVSPDGAAITLCNDGVSRAYCVAEQTGTDASVRHGEAPYGVSEAETATLDGDSTAWSASSSATRVSVSVSPSALSADGTSTATVTATARDADGAPVLGDHLVISSSDPGQQIGPVLDNHDGTYSAVLTSSRTVASATVTASDTSAIPAPSGQVSLIQTAPPPPPPAPATRLTLQIGSSRPVSGTSAQTVATVSVQNAAGGPVAADDVNLSVSGPVPATVGPVQANGDGDYTATISSTIATGTDTVTATDTTVTPALTQSASLHLAAAPLRVKRAGTGTGTVSADQIACPGRCSATYASGQVLTLTARPGAGSSFAGWSGACRGTRTCRLTLTGPTVVTATFSRPLPGFHDGRADLGFSGRPILSADGAQITIALHNANRFDVRLLGATLTLEGHNITVATHRRLLRADASWPLTLRLSPAQHRRLQRARSAALGLALVAQAPDGDRGASRLRSAIRTR